MKSKKILIVALFLIIALFALTGCGTKSDENKSEEVKTKNSDKNNTATTENLEEIYKEVLDGKRNFIFGIEDKNIQAYINDVSLANSTDAKIVSYSYVDLDSDGTIEMVALIEHRDGEYLILNYEDGKVYGFEEVYRGMGSLKTDGTYLGSGGADTSAILKSNFAKAIREEETLASNDMGKYEIEGKTVTEDEINKYYEDFFKKEDAKFIQYTK